MSLRDELEERLMKDPHMQIERERREKYKFILPPGNIYVELLPKEAAVGKIILPQNSSQITRIGIVREVGEGITLYKPGDVVLMTYYEGTWLHIPSWGITDERHKICVESSILCKVEA